MASSFSSSWMPFFGDDFWESERVAAMDDSAALLYTWLLWRRWSTGPLPSSLELQEIAPRRFRARWNALWLQVEPMLDFSVGIAPGVLERVDALRVAAAAVDESSRRAYARRQERLKAARALGTHTDEEWRQILALVSMVCPRCGVVGADLEKDHVVPLFLGGSDAPENLQPLCKPCNVTKRDESIDWLGVRGMRP